MPAALDTLSTAVRRPVNVSILVAIAMAVLASLLGSVLHGEALGASLLLAIGVIVPTAYREQWAGHRSVTGAVGWTVVASALAGAAIVGGTLALGTYGGRSGPTAAAVAFVVTSFGGLLVVSRLSQTASA